MDYSSANAITHISFFSKQKQKMLHKTSQFMNTMEIYKINRIYNLILKRHLFNFQILTVTKPMETDGIFKNTNQRKLLIFCKR